MNEKGAIVNIGPGSVQTAVEYIAPPASAASSTAASSVSDNVFTPQDIIETYEVLAPMATDYANANLERAGQAQASYGPLAQAAMGGSQTAGIGNYTYNRLVRPAVDTMRDQLIVEGYSAALNKQLSDSLNEAKKNYNRAARRYNNNPSTTTTTTGGGQTKIKGSVDNQVEEDYKSNTLYLSGSEAFAGTVNRYDHKLKKDELESIFGRTMPQKAYDTYSDLYDKRNKSAGSGIFQGSGR